MSKTLHLTLKKKWFDMTDSGEKPEEYREIKPYWIKRLMNDDGSFKEFDCIKARHGYKKDAPFWNRKWVGVKIATGQLRWGAFPGKEYFVIKLGERIK